EHREALARFGEHLGMAFQITDDLLDYTESEEVTGKPVGLDLKEHKVTLPLIAALGQMGQRERRVVADLMAAPDPPDDLVGEVIATIGPVHIDLLVVSITLGPIGLDVSLLALVGVVIAYFFARSIF